VGVRECGGVSLCVSSDATTCTRRVEVSKKKKNTTAVSKREVNDLQISFLCIEAQYYETSFVANLLISFS